MNAVVLFDFCWFIVVCDNVSNSATMPNCKSCLVVDSPSLSVLHPLEFLQWFFSSFENDGIKSNQRVICQNAYKCEHKIWSCLSATATHDSQTCNINIINRFLIFIFLIYEPNAKCSAGKHSHQNKNRILLMTLLNSNINSTSGDTNNDSSLPYRN